MVLYVIVVVVVVDIATIKKNHSRVRFICLRARWGALLPFGYADADGGDAIAAFLDALASHGDPLAAQLLTRRSVGVTLTVVSAAGPCRPTIYGLFLLEELNKYEKCSAIRRTN